MATTMSLPAVPLGFDNGLSATIDPDVDDPLIPLLLPQDFAYLDEAMRTGYFSSDAIPSSYDDAMLVDDYDFISPVDLSNAPNHSSSLAGGHVAASGAHLSSTHLSTDQSTARPAIESLSGGSSRSPGTTNSLILTPSSTHLDYNASISGSNFAEEDDVDENRSPASDRDFVLLPPHTSRAGPQPSHMSSQHRQSSSEASGPTDAQHQSRDSSIAPSNASFSGATWGNIDPAARGIGDSRHLQYAGLGGPNLLAPTTYQFQAPTYTAAHQNYNEVFSSSLDPWNTTMLNSSLPFRSVADQQIYSQNFYNTNPSSITPSLYPQQMTDSNQGSCFALQQHQHAQRMMGEQARMRGLSGMSFQQPLNTSSTGSLMAQPQESMVTAPLKMEQPRLLSSPIQPSVGRTSIPSSQMNPRPQQIQAGSHLVEMNVAHPQSSTTRPSRPTAPVRPLQAAKAKQPYPTTAAPRPSAPEQSRKGGRRRGEHLDNKAKEKSSKMRKVVACWRCALQRDPCDEGMPCNRCTMRLQKGQAYFFDCDRSKLPDFVHDFLPPTTTLMHQKQTIEDTVSDQVVEWDLKRPLNIYLTSGYGPDLCWKVYEFKPKTRDLLGQFQYLQNPETGVQERIHKYSPPLGLLKLDASDDDHVEEYLKTLLHEEHLQWLGWTCFEEESQVDGAHFQAYLLQLMCNLYLETQDEDLKHLLQEVLRMIIITYIMGHTLTLHESTLPDVLSHIHHSPRAPPQPFTSPRLANRQLKFYFAILRGAIYEKLLRWQQQTLHTSGKKENTWLPSFCAMLGFAMVLEEVQRTIQIQADAKGVKGEMNWDQATTEARNACERIDERYKLLVGLFQCKYRDKKWGEHGSFGPATPRYEDAATREFLREVRTQLEERQDHLNRRKDVQYAASNQCLYTSRLVARFLLPFLDLPRT